MTDSIERDQIARTIWNAESLRTHGRNRTVSWEAGVSNDDRNKYLFIADAIIAARTPPPVADQAVAGLVKALESFAEFARFHGDDHEFIDGCYGPTVGHARKARAALEAYRAESSR